MTIPNRSTWHGLGIALAGLLAGTAAQAALKVFACEPEWGALARELGGPQVEVTVATTALQDPHHIQARPSLIARMRNADLVVCTGAELEEAWLPPLLQQSGNAKVQAGQAGHFEAADFVRRLGVPEKPDRAQGDVHAAGNPHIQTDPRRIAHVATALAERLRRIDPGNAAEYSRREADFAQRWQRASDGWSTRAAPLKGLPVVSQHQSFSYLYEWLGLREVAVLEPKPGVEPTVSHLQSVQAALRATPARMVLHAAYQDARAAEWLNKNAGVPVVKLPFTVGGSEAAKDLFGLFDDTVARLLAGAAAGSVAGSAAGSAIKP